VTDTEWVNTEACTTTDEACLSCAEGSPRAECPYSPRDCGHHCNHSWDQDECCYCGAVFGDQDDPAFGVPTIDNERNAVPTMIDKTGTLEDLRDAQQNFSNAETAYAEATAKRTHAVQQALRAGHRQQQVAEALGVSRGRVGQIAGDWRLPDAESE
jgi:hypothetical protein